jgi:hypothetical protein
MTQQQRESAFFAFACTDQAPVIVQMLISYWEMHPTIPEAEILMQALRCLSDQNAALLETVTRLTAIGPLPPIILGDSDAAKLRMDVNLDLSHYDLSALNPYFDDEEPFRK